MDRNVAYLGQVPLEENFTLPQRNGMVALAKLSEAVFGTGVTTEGLDVVPTAPASLAVRVNAGQLYAMASLDAVAYGNLPADIAHQIVKQGIMLDPQTIPISPPGTPGFSQWYLIQAAFQERDEGAVVLPYYNSANPSQAYSGPGNSGEAQYTQRNGRVVLQVKAGAPAATGSHQAPNADAGWTQIAWVGVANGQTTIQAQHIVASEGRRRAALKLPDIGLSMGYRAIRINQSRNLTLEDMGVVVVDVGAFTGEITLTLPPANSIPGVPLHVTILGRAITPIQGGATPRAFIVPRAGNSLDFSPIYCAVQDNITLVSDGNTNWHWTNQKHAANTMLVHAAQMTIPHNLEVNVTWQVLNANSIWFNPAQPTRIVAPTWARIKVTGQASFSPSASGSIRQARFVMNNIITGSGLAAASTAPAGAFTPHISLSGGAIGVSPSYYLEMRVYQDSGAPLTINASDTWMSLEVLD